MTIVLILTISTASTATATSTSTPQNTRRVEIAQRINRALDGGHMRGTGYIFERVGRRYHLSPYFMVAAAGTEAGATIRVRGVRKPMPGVHGCSNNRFNVWGLSSCGSGWYVPDWDGRRDGRDLLGLERRLAWQRASRFYAQFLKRQWPHARTTYDYRGYALCSPCWGRKTAYWMRLLFGVGPEVRYP